MSYVFDFSNLSPKQDKIERVYLYYDPIEHCYRSHFQKDRDRILISRGFNRLQKKALDSLSNKNVYTHSIEVAQIARTIAKALNLDQELVEAMALGHDLGRAPFSYIGERTLHKIMTGQIKLNSKLKETDLKGFRGYKHNWQSVVFSSLYEWEMNLTNYTLYGMLNHATYSDKQKYKEEDLDYYLTFDADRVAYQANKRENLYINLIKGKHSLEAYIVYYANLLAKRHHDIDMIIDNCLNGEHQELLDAFNIKDNIDHFISHNKFMSVKMMRKYKLDMYYSMDMMLKRDSLFKKYYGKLIINLYTTDLIFNIVNNFKDYLFKKDFILDDLSEEKVKERVKLSEVLLEDDIKYKEFLNQYTYNNHDETKFKEKDAQSIIIELFELYLNKLNQVVNDDTNSIIIHFFHNMKHFIIGHDDRDEYNIQLIGVNELRRQFNEIYQLACETDDLTEEVMIFQTPITIEYFIKMLYRTICDHIATMTDDYVEIVLEDLKK